MVILKTDSFDQESIHSQSIGALNDKIQSRPVLYFNNELDLTDEIIEALNKIG